MSEEAPRPRIFLSCPWCEAGGMLSEFGSVRYPDTAEHGPGGSAHLYRCERCQQPSVFVVEDYGTGDIEGPFRAWPDPRRFLSVHVPDQLRREYEQARSCFEAKAYTAAVVMVRRTLEGLTELNDASGKSLFDKLQSMVDAGQLDRRLYEWADMLRVVGNEGAHFTGNQVSRADAADSLAMCEAILDNMYVLTVRFARFKERRNRN
jgi:hypothetical protein